MWFSSAFVPFVLQVRSLADAKPVLLICNHKSKISVLNPLRDQSMGAKYNLPFSAGSRGMCFLLFTLFQTANKKACMDSAFFEICSCGQIMLTCKNFSWSHHGSLESCLYTHADRSEGNCSFSASNISLNQPCHGLLSAHVLDDFAENPLLRLRW